MDEIRLTLPREGDFYGVAHLVMGGVAARLDLTVETLDDLQVALGELLGEHDAADEVTLVLRRDEGVLEAEVGPVAGAPSGGELERRVLETVTDDYRIVERDGTRWARVRKRIPREPLSER